MTQSSRKKKQKGRGSLEAARNRGQELLKSGVLDPPPLKFLKKGMTPEEIRQKREEIEAKLQRIKNEEQECFEIMKELRRVCRPHQNIVGTVDGDSCPDCGYSNCPSY
jgi:hypothetical protein